MVGVGGCGYRGRVPHSGSDSRIPRSGHATLGAVEHARVTLTGDISGDYVVEDHRADGRLVLRPDISVTAILARHGERELTGEEFEQHFGHLPTD